MNDYSRWRGMTIYHVFNTFVLGDRLESEI